MRGESDEASAGFGCDSTAGRALAPRRLSSGLGLGVVSYRVQSAKWSPR